MSERCIGVDIGGTNTKLIWLEPPSKVLDRGQVDSRRASAEDLVDAIVTAIRPWTRGSAPATAMGIGVAGLVERGAGRVVGAPNLDILRDFAIGPALRDAAGLRTELDNDANAAGLAEARLGAAVGCDSAVCLTVGTGVGGALIAHGRLWRGHSGMAGELGRVLLDEEAQEYFEEGVGAAAVVREYYERSGLDPAEGEIEAVEVSRRAEAGDEAARQALARCGERLGLGLAILVNLFNPERIVIGGGLAGAGSWFLDAARREGERRAWIQAWRACEVVVGRLGGDAGAIGAALLCLEQDDDI